jgi:large subunit ribosomal protein L29
MRAKDIRELSDQELDSKESELRESIFRFRLRRGTNQLESSAALRSAKRDLARVKTVKNQREKTRGDQG